MTYGNNDFYKKKKQRFSFTSRCTAAERHILTVQQAFPMQAYLPLTTELSLFCNNEQFQN